MKGSPLFQSVFFPSQKRASCKESGINGLDPVEGAGLCLMSLSPYLGIACPFLACNVCHKRTVVQLFFKGKIVRITKSFVKGGQIPVINIFAAVKGLISLYLISKHFFLFEADPGQLKKKFSFPVFLQQSHSSVLVLFSRRKIYLSSISEL